MNRVIWYSPSGKPEKSVISNFLGKTLKKMHQARGDVLAHLKLLETTDLLAMRKAGILSQVRGEILEYRINTKDHWVRVLAASLDGGGLVLLGGTLKKRNQLDGGEVEQAEMNLRIFKQQLASGLYGSYREA